MKRYALRLKNDEHPLYWGSLLCGEDGWCSDLARAYFWSADTLLMDAVKNGLPDKAKDLHGRTHYMCAFISGTGTGATVLDASWQLQGYKGLAPLIQLVPMREDTVACMCGDTNCPSCGPAQGYNPDFDLVCEYLDSIIQWPEPLEAGPMNAHVAKQIGNNGPLDLAYALADLAKDWHAKLRAIQRLQMAPAPKKDPNG